MDPQNTQPPATPAQPVNPPPPDPGPPTSQVTNPINHNNAQAAPQVNENNLAAAMIRKKIQTIQPLSAEEKAEIGQTETLGPQTHAAHVAYPNSAQQPTQQPVQPQPAATPRSYHEQQYLAQAQPTQFQQHQNHPIEENLHKSDEKVPKHKAQPKAAPAPTPPQPQPQPQPQTQPVPAAQTPTSSAQPAIPTQSSSPAQTSQTQSAKQPQQPTKPAERSHTLKRKEPTEKMQKTGFKRPILIALILGFAYLIINYNEIAVAQVKQYITPSSGISTPVIVDPDASPIVSGEAKIIIPKINVDVPVVYDITSYDEGQIQAGLERGVVHYGTTALPGEVGNNVIVGHSSNNFFNSGRYKFAFVLLDRLENDDTFSLHYQGTRYTYRVFNKQVIDPTDFSLIQSTDRPVTTLITCSPPGTSWRRLVIQAEQILPDPSGATESTQSQELPDSIDGPVPGNSPSLWSRIF